MPPTKNIFCNFDGLNSPSLVVDLIFLLPACCTISTTLSCQCCRCDSSRYHFEGDCGLEWGVHRVDLPSPPGRRRLGGEEEEEPGGWAAAAASASSVHLPPLLLGVVGQGAREAGLQGAHARLGQQLRHGLAAALLLDRP
uniref:Uncharacterized protein n=1 Tax=Heterosigma akashiwo TaxID=2829 RepID=A0A7S3XPT8_HETAK